MNYKSTPMIHDIVNPTLASYSRMPISEEFLGWRQMETKEEDYQKVYLQSLSPAHLSKFLFAQKENQFWRVHRNSWWPEGWKDKSAQSLFSVQVELLGNRVGCWVHCKDLTWLLIPLASLIFISLGTGIYTWSLNIFN